MGADFSPFPEGEGSLLPNPGGRGELLFSRLDANRTESGGGYSCGGDSTHCGNYTEGGGDSADGLE